MLLGAIVAVAILNPAPAFAAGEPCTKPLCGWLKNAGSVNIIVSTDYTSNGQVAGGARQTTVKANGTTPGGYDWDAFWVPAGYCGTINDTGGYRTVSRIGSRTGIWVKFNDTGAPYVKLGSGTCLA